MPIDISINFIKFVPSVWLYRKIVRVYSDTLYPLSEGEKLSDIQRKAWMMDRRRATLLFSTFFAPIATVTLITFVQRGLSNAFNYSIVSGPDATSSNPALPRTLPTSESKETQGVGSTVKM